MNFSEKLIGWFEKNKRDLPWRKTKNPYFIWVSEIILQQTRVEQGLPYYKRFIKKFPTIKDLATAREDDVMKQWQGLGYYSRARNMHCTAKEICKSYKGKFPEKFEEILSLKGIGKYTASAISSFAFNLPFPVVDGNVQRVFARIFGISDSSGFAVAEKKFYSLGHKLLDKTNPGTFNQAIMEFGAIHCTPLLPKCNHCVFSGDCFALKTNRVKEFPSKKIKVKPRTRFFYYLIIKAGDSTFIKKRKGNDIWIDLYEFPLIESAKALSKNEILHSAQWKNFFGNISVKIISISKYQKHILSHQLINGQFWEVEMPSGTKIKQALKTFQLVKFTNLNKFPVSRMIEKYMVENGEGFTKNNRGK